MTYDIVHQDWEPLDSNQSMNDMKLVSMIEEGVDFEPHAIFNGEYKIYIQKCNLLDKQFNCYMGTAMRLVIKFENEEDAILCKLII